MKNISIVRPLINETLVDISTGKTFSVDDVQSASVSAALRLYHNIIASMSSILHLREKHVTIFSTTT